MERDAHIWRLSEHIFQGSQCSYPHKAPSTEPLQREKPHPQSPLHPLKVTSRRAVLQDPQTGPLWKEMPISRAIYHYD